jgi:hypothetical protein
MQEPHVSSTVYDMTGGLQPAPSDDGYNIAMPVYSPTGPITRTKVLSQKDFIDKYMTGTSMTPTDDISTIMAYMTLAKNPLYVVRACPETVLEGIGCTGRHYLFDKNKHILDKYYQFTLTKGDNPKSYYGIGSATNDNDDTFIVGTKDGKTPLDNSEDLDKLCQKLLLASQGQSDIKIVSVNSQNKIVSQTALKFSDNIAVLNEITQKNVFQSVTSASNEVATGSYVIINGNTYYYRGDNTVDATEFLNPQAIVIGNTSSNLDSAVFLFLVQQKTNCDYLCNDVTLGFKDGNTTLDIANTNGVLGAEETTWKFKIADHSAIDNNTVDPNGSTFWGKVQPNAEVTISNNLPTIGGTSLSRCTMLTNSDTAHSFMFLAKIDDKINLCCVSLYVDPEDSDNITVKSKQNIRVTDRYSINNAIIAKWSALDNNLGFSHTNEITLLVPTYTSMVVHAGEGSSAALVGGSGENVSYYTYFLANNSNNLDLLKYDSLFLQIDNVLYYTNTTVGLPISINSNAETLVQMATHSVNINEFIGLLKKFAYQTQKINYVNNAFVSATLISSVSCSSQFVVSGNIEEVDQTNRSEQFAVVQNFPSTQASFQYSYSLIPDSVDAMGSIYNLVLKVKGGEIIENWTMSFDSGKVDGYGVDQWYTRVQSDYFTVVNLQEENVKGEILDSYNSLTWGNAVSLPSFDVQFAIDALQQLLELDDGIKYDVISDGGIVNTTLASACEALAMQLNSVYPASLPPTELSVNSLKSYVGAADLKSYEIRLLAAGDRINVAGFSVPLAGSYKLILQLIDRFRNKASEFAPNFNIQNGSVGVSNLIQKWDKSERESLLDARIATLKGGVNTDWYINKNITAQKAITYLSEEQNVRMTNTAIHVVEKASVQYIGQLNTANLRSTVEERTNLDLQERLFKNKTETPAYYYAVCNDTNNTTSTINANMLVISLYASFTPSVQDVLIKNIIQPLDQAQ